MVDIEIFKKGMAKLSVNYDRFELTQDRMNLFYEYFRELNDEQWKYCVDEYIGTEQFAPTIGGLKSKINNLDVSVESKADEFVGHARALLGIYGAEALLEIFGGGTFPLRNPKKFIDPIAYEVVKRNLDRLRTHDVSDDMALHAQLKKMYISEYQTQKANHIKSNNPQLFSNEIKKLSETLKLE